MDDLGAIGIAAALGGAGIALTVWAAIFIRWQRGLEWLLVFLPFAGYLTMFLRPNPLAILIKDFLIVIPLYIALFVLRPKALRNMPVPRVLMILLFLFSVIIMLQWLNPALANFVVAAIGTKVWLFYVPLMFVAAAAIERRETLIWWLRLMLIVATVPTAVGLLQFFMSSTVGYYATMTLFYGRFAAEATQGFTTFNFGGTLYRIPSTFTFVTQYFGFTMAMLVPAYALLYLETSGTWRRFARIMMAVIIIASMLSGARSAFVFIPLTLALALLIDGRITGLIGAIFAAPVLVLVALDLGNLDPAKILGGTQDLAQGYSEGLVIDTITEALIYTPFGTGTGMNTGAARYGLPDVIERSVLLESLYAKTIVELGIPGLAILIGIFVSLILFGLQQVFVLKDRALKSTAAAIIAFVIAIVINSFKGWQIDVDPVNIYFWFFIGILFKLKALDVKTMPAFAARRQTAVQRPQGWQPLRGRPIPEQPFRR
ncbi:MAG: hypothetical protein HY057_04670 [Rhodospirillales bacterium]|nr:hypothetical protein [Rhodospirillales bacterium]